MYTMLPQGGVLLSLHSCRPVVELFSKGSKPTQKNISPKITMDSDHAQIERMPSRYWKPFAASLRNGISLFGL